MIVDQAGGAWWVWDTRGDVLVTGESSKVKALAALDLCAEDAADAEDAEDAE